MAFCLLNKIPHQIIVTRLIKGDHRTEEFLKLNPIGTVPTMVDGDFSLGESYAILKYLQRTRNCPDSWYPIDIRKRAAVD